MTQTHADSLPAPPVPDDTVTLPARPGRLRAWWNTVVGAIGTLVGLAPHVLHHIGPLAGTALIAGAGGTALFGALGFVAALPLLLRLRRRYCNWWAPAIALVIFAAMFSLSAFVVGPAISGGETGGVSDTPGGDPSPAPGNHEQHHNN